MNCPKRGRPFGFKHKPETRLKMRLKALGDKNVMWKGDKVGYLSLHEWIRNRLEKPDICPCCEEKPVYDIACYTGIYDRDLDNYVYLCRSCHTTLDYKTGMR